MLKIAWSVEQHAILSARSQKRRALINLCFVSQAIFGNSQLFSHLVHKSFLETVSHSVIQFISEFQRSQLKEESAYQAFVVIHFMHFQSCPKARQSAILWVCQSASLPVYYYVSIPVRHYLLLFAQLQLTTSESPTSAFRQKFSVMFTPKLFYNFQILLS